MMTTTPAVATNNAVGPAYDNVGAGGGGGGALEGDRDGDGGGGGVTGRGGGAGGRRPWASDPTSPTPSQPNKEQPCEGDGQRRRPRAYADVGAAGGGGGALGGDRDGGGVTGSVWGAKKGPSGCGGKVSYRFEPRLHVNIIPQWHQPVLTSC